MQTIELLQLTDLDQEHRISVLRRAQRRHPDDYWINFKLAYALDYTPPPVQNQDEAIRFYTAAIACRPENAPANYYLGHALDQRGRRGEAISAFQRSIELNPDFTWPRDALCAIYFKQGKLDLAIAEYKRATDHNAADAGAHEKLGQAFSLQGRTAEAMRDYEKALELDAKSFRSYNNLAWMLATCREHRLRNPSRAVALAKSAVEREKKNAACWNTLGVALCRNGKWKEAIEALEQICRHPGLLELRRLLSRDRHGAARPTR